jgi:hypothetical protein
MIRCRLFFLWSTIDGIVLLRTNDPFERLSLVFTSVQPFDKTMILLDAINSFSSSKVNSRNSGLS